MSAKTIPELENAMNRRFENVESRIDANSGEIRKLGVQVDANSKDIRKLGVQVDANSKEIRKIGLKVDMNSKEILKLSHKVSRNSEGIHNLGLQLENMDHKLDTLLEIVTPAVQKTEKIDSIDSSVADHEYRIRALETPRKPK